MAIISFELPIYTYQIDFIGHVNNIVYIQWMEIARMKLMEAIDLPVHQAHAQGFVPVLVHTEITYKNPLYLGETVRVELWLSELRKASAQMEFRFYNSQNILAAEGRQRGLFVTHATMRPRRLGAEEQALFTPFLLSET
ncbi:thioesterase family protein [Leptolyngbya sp. FACHB-261]|uniref:acyl-CoA thioesterase n=1 Tax=Leptolyngbya sp. FACHB-261 TaxID=2692806 RepID=UPI0016860246|nr:acyl-CoA thioesterase [Leptolyngbya sp. FACHB-261]MBD2103676.1 acyl-CoA thioesterase [Leptolyngbya sp. FACHB-261]